MNDSMSSQLKLYANIEALLRKAEKDSEPLLMREIAHHETVEPYTKTAWHARDIVRTMVQQGYVISEGETSNMKYYWNVDKTDHPEVKPYRIRRQARPFKDPNMEPGQVSVARPDVPPEPVAQFGRIVQDIDQLRGTTLSKPKDVELVIGPHTIVLGTNPVTGRLRITIDT